MRKFTVQPGAPPSVFHAVVGGGAGSGKTSFAATAPRPLFLADNVEKGYQIIETMNPDLFWNPKQPPEIWAIEKIQDSIQAVADLEKMAATGKFPYGTVSFDPFSIYCDRFLTEMPQPNDRRQLYGDLWTHIFVLIRRLHALPCNIFWLSHVKEGELQIPGQASEKLPAMCESRWLTEVVTERNKPPLWQLRTTPSTGGKFVSCRYNLPETLLPSFKCIAAVLGLAQQPATPWVLGPNGEMWSAG
jgi:hypothetical protein